VAQLNPLLINQNISMDMASGEQRICILTAYIVQGTRVEGINKQCNSTIKALHRVRHYNPSYWRIKL